MKKFRGKQRYFRNLEKETHIKNYDLDFDENSWFDFWHTHLDYYRYGNYSIKIRKQHLKGLFNLFHELKGVLKKIGKTYQMWIEISSNDASMDTLFIHSPNPNEDNFPYKKLTNLVDVRSEIPSYLTEIIDVENYKIESYESIEDGITDKIFVIQFLDIKSL